MKLEDSIKKLKEISSKLEEKDVSLDESLALYEEGATLAKDCLKKIDEYKGKVFKITQELEVTKEEELK